ncbi:hypothetical protein WA026_001886 [Henosepilachna vigintioctopunctata]|uniref:Uncharacterized protein n=1 Tax=Henosepilachna vigintioctopunctata TaxID=420089 RepID=A0AAW1UKW2_9CUCU
MNTKLQHLIHDKNIENYVLNMNPSTSVAELANTQNNEEEFTQVSNTRKNRKSPSNSRRNSINTNHVSTYNKFGVLSEKNENMETEQIQQNDNNQKLTELRKLPPIIITFHT